ncbi:MAG: MBL fold metallo-hydrolase [Stackebrandtia sp.]
MKITVDKVVTNGVFTLDGGQWDVDNNVWLLGNDSEVLVIDAAHDARAIAAAIGKRRVPAIVCTHAHNDHINAAVALAERLPGEVPIMLHPEDTVLWDQTHPGRPVDSPLHDGQLIEAAGIRLEVRHTPGHAPGAVCLYAPDLATVFTGDTLFEGGPGATGRSYSDRGTLVASIKSRLFTLPPETVVHTGHGPDTTIGAEVANLG